MTKDEALDLALEALETIANAMPFPVGKSAITAIKQARSAPVPENFMDALRFDLAMRDAAPVQEPVAWIDMSAWPPIRFREGVLRSDLEHLDGLPLCTTPPAAQRRIEELEAQLMLMQGREIKLQMSLSTPAAQRQWVGLTDDERLEVAEIDGADEWFWKVCKAIEAKLKEKNT
jgi:hypothetical protein